jgi:hypothetical protein
LTVAMLKELVEEPLTVEVNDPFGQHQVVLEGVRPTTTANEILAMAMSEMQLPPNVTWDLRDEGTSRLLNEKQPLSDLADEEAPHVRLTMQPNAGLG